MALAPLGFVPARTDLSVYRHRPPKSTSLAVSLVHDFPANRHICVRSRPVASPLAADTAQRDCVQAPWIHRVQLKLQDAVLDPRTEDRLHF